MSAANAEPAPEVHTAREADQKAESVVDSAMATVVEHQARAGGGPSAKKPAPVVAVANLEPSASLDSAPGPEAGAEDVARWLSTAWKRGKSAGWIRNKLDQNTPDKLDQGRVVLTTGDFNTDGRTDLGAAFFAECTDSDCIKGGQWVVGVVWASKGWSRLATSESAAPEFLGPVDLTGDDYPELVFAIEKCGAHTCYKNVEVLSAHGSEQFRRILYLGDDVEGHGSRGLPQQVEVIAPEGDDLARLKVSGGLVASAGAGRFQRLAHEIWGWRADSGKIELLETRWEPSELRLHRFHDAIVALEGGETKRAKKLFGEVIESDELDELPEEMQDPALEEAMRTQLAHTARFMLARLALEQGDTDRFARLRDELLASAPKSPPALAAKKLGEVWQGVEQASAACKAAAKLFPEASGDDWVLDAIDLGYNAPVKFGAGVERGLCAGLE